MVHDLSPFMIQFTETFGLRWYGFSYLLGFVFAYIVISWLAKRQQAGLEPEQVSDFIFYGAIGTMIGGRLGYCIFYDPELFWSFSWSFPFWKVLAVHEGGMASHGGIIGIVAACWLYGRKHRINWVYLLDVVSIAGPIGVFFGRIANFINGELVGRIAPADFPYGVKFPKDIESWPAYEFERLGTLTPVVEKLNMTGSRWLELIGSFRSDMAARDEVYATLNKIMFEIQNKNIEVKEAIAPLLDYRYPSQLFAAASEGLLTFLLLFLLARKSHKAGFIASAFIVCYAVARIVNEMFRMPDIQIGFQLLGLTRGQWLSVGMLTIGLVMMFYWNRTQSQVVHGWVRGEHVKLGTRKVRR